MTNSKVIRISVPEVEFSVVVSDRNGLERWTQIILQSGHLPQFFRVH